MFKKIYFWISDYFSRLGEYMSDFWQNMNPTKYGVMLIMVGVIAWFLMRNRMKRL